MKINNNIYALEAYRQMLRNQTLTEGHLEKLSSGLRINRSSDDAAGLSISEKMRSQIRGLGQAERNALDGISLIQTAEGALQEVHAMLQRIRELSVQAANETNAPEDRQEIQKEVNQLRAEMERIGDNTEFNTKTLLDGQFSTQFQIGANEGQILKVKIPDTRPTALQIDTIDLTTSKGANEAIGKVEQAIETIASIRSSLGAYQNRLEHTVQNLSSTTLNLTAAESRVRDADMALEMTYFTKQSILNQSATAMLAQANQMPQGVLQLLQ